MSQVSKTVDVSSTPWEGPKSRGAVTLRRLLDWQDDLAMLPLFIKAMAAVLAQLSTHGAEEHQHEYS
jgi:hypothetical protein